MVIQKLGWIFAQAEFIQERELIEKIQEKKAEKKGDKKVNRLIGKDDEDDDEGFTIFPEDLTPTYRKVRFLKEDVKNWMQSVDDENLTAVTLKFEDTMYFLKCSIEEFDKVFFE